MYEIEKGVPMPGHNVTRAGEASMPLARMEIGDSFFIPADCTTKVKGIKNRITAATARFRKLTGEERRFVTHQYLRADPAAPPWGDRPGVRCWRVK